MGVIATEGRHGHGHPGRGFHNHGLRGHAKESWPDICLLVIHHEDSPTVVMVMGSFMAVDPSWKAALGVAED